MIDLRLHFYLCFYFQIFTVRSTSARTIVFGRIIFGSGSFRIIDLADCINCEVHVSSCQIRLIVFVCQSKYTCSFTYALKKKKKKKSFMGRCVHEFYVFFPTFLL